MFGINRAVKVRKSKRIFIPLLVLLAVFMSQLSVAQTQCAFCQSQKSVRAVKFGKETHYLCHKCRNKPQACDLCYRRTKPESLLRDGRRVCGTCKKSRILTQEQLDSVYDGLKSYLKRDPAGLLVDDPPPLQIADKDEIQTKFTRSGRSMEVAGFYQPYNPEQIYVLSGQTRAKCAATIIHEYTHAWQTRNCPSQDRALKEGFASWVEYRYLVSQGRRQEAQQLTRRSDPDYGESLVKLLKLEKEVGVKGVVKYAKTKKDLPK